jgi:EthD domain
MAAACRDKLIRPESISASPRPGEADGFFRHLVLTSRKESALPAMFSPHGPAGEFAAVAVRDLAAGHDPTARDRLDGDLLTREETAYDHGRSELTIFSFLTRRPELSREAFAADWRRFGELFLSTTELSDRCCRYAQDHVISVEAAGFDGVAEMGFRGIGDVVDFLAEPALAEKLFPAEEPFIDRSRGLVLLTRP